jgi:dihydrolipoamide dehydrogenase
MSDSFDLVVIGSGPGGYVAAIRASQLGFRTACVEKSPVLGGTCLNIGCIPSKTLLHSSELYWKVAKEGREMGLSFERLGYNFKEMMRRKSEVISGFNEGISLLFRKNKITSFQGEAHFTSPKTIDVGGKRVEGKFFILATGSEPLPLPFLPFDERQILSSTGALSLQKPPKKLLIIGAGVIGVEMGSIYNRLGSEVVFVEFLERLCPALDEALSKALQEALEKQGMLFHFSSKVSGAEIKQEKVILKVEREGALKEMEADHVLVSIGRRPYTQGLGLETIGVERDQKGFIPIDGHFRTSLPHIFAIGDLVDGPMLAHKASEEGVAVAELLAGHQPQINYMAIPNVVYTSPEVASVGVTEKEAQSAGLSIKIGSFPFKANSRARCTGEEEGFVKLIVEKTSDRIVGIHIIGAHASELIAEGALAIQNGLTLKALQETPYAHPTLSEALKEAALAADQRALHR